MSGVMETWMAVPVPAANGRGKAQREMICSNYTLGERASHAIIWIYINVRRMHM